MTDELASLQDALQIDQDSLDEMLIRHPGLYREVGDGHAMCESLRDKAKADLDGVVAELDLEIRSNSKDAKLTEPLIANMVKLQPSYTEAHDEYLRLKELTARWKALLDSFAQRGFALNHLVTLWVGGYWGNAGGNTSREQAFGRVREDIRDILGKERVKRRV